MSIRTFCKSLLLSAAALSVTSSGAVFAASGDIDRDGSVLYITGDEWDDYCQVYMDGDEIEIELMVYDEDGDLDDTDTRDYDLEDIDLIVFEGLAGDDDFWNSTPVPCIASGGSGNDVLLGGWSDDELKGGSGDDLIAGRSGDDDLYGGTGSDYLYGGSGNDYLNAGAGEEEWVIAGQSGSDTFATPAFFSYYLYTLVPIDRAVGYEDFNAQEDTEYLFWSLMYGRTMMTSNYQLRR